MNRQQEAFVRRLVQETVRETLAGLGFDLGAPNKLQADMHYLRQIRSGSEEMGRVLRRSAITLRFTTGLYLMWDAEKATLNR